MRDYYRRLDKKGLYIDQKLNLFAETIRYCEEKCVEYVRFAQLKDLCNNKYLTLTDGERGVGGGSFNSLMIKVSDPTLPDDKRYFDRIQVSNKETRFYPNIGLIKTYLQNNQISHDGSEYDTIRRVIRQTIPITTTLSMKVIRAADRING